MTRSKKFLRFRKRDNIPSYVAADRLAEERIARVAKSRGQFLQNEKSVLTRKNN